MPLYVAEFQFRYRKATPLEIVHVRRWRQDLVGLLSDEREDDP
jgi:hypothetical protein